MPTFFSIQKLLAYALKDSLRLCLRYPLGHVAVSFRKWLRIVKPTLLPIKRPNTYKHQF